MRTGDVRYLISDTVDDKSDARHDQIDNYAEEKTLPHLQSGKYFFQPEVDICLLFSVR